MCSRLAHGHVRACRRCSVADRRYSRRRLAARGARRVLVPLRPMGERLESGVRRALHRKCEPPALQVCPPSGSMLDAAARRSFVASTTNRVVEALRRGELAPSAAPFLRPTSWWLHVRTTSSTASITISRLHPSAIALSAGRPGRLTALLCVHVPAGGGAECRRETVGPRALHSQRQSP